MITQARLKELLHYDPETGIFTRIKSYCSRAIAGTAAGSKDSNGYLRIRLGGAYAAHRLAFIYMTGKYPNVIDHINGNPSDNRWINIRSVTRAENAKNQKIGVRNSTGSLGVYWVAEGKKWRSKIKVGGKQINLGLFSNINDARAARLAAEKKYNFHPNHGRAAVGPTPAPSVNVQGSLFAEAAC